jgi:hypothetical protein
VVHRGRAPTQARPPAPRVPCLVMGSMQARLPLELH